MALAARALATLKELARVLVDENDNVLGGGNPIQVGGSITTVPSGTTTVDGTVVAKVQGLEGKNSTYQDVRLDPSTLTMQTIEYEHHEIHGGSAYVVTGTDADLDTDAELTIAFTTPDTTKWIHLLALASCTSAAYWEVLEGPTITNGTGSDLVIYNKNRNSANTSGVLTIESPAEAGKATLTPTITNDGTVLQAQYLGSGKEKISGEIRATGEWVLKQNTTYAFRLTGNADNGKAAIELVWYEHTDKV